MTEKDLKRFIKERADPYYTRMYGNLPKKKQFTPAQIREIAAALMPQGDSVEGETN